MKEMLAFKEQLEKVEAEQKQAPRRTRSRSERSTGSDRGADEGRRAEAEGSCAARRRARKDVDGAQPGVTMRAEPEFEHREGGAEGPRARARDEGARGRRRGGRAAPHPRCERLAHAASRRTPRSRERGRAHRTSRRIGSRRRRSTRSARCRRCARSATSSRSCFPDPREVLSKDDQKRLGELSKRAGRARAARPGELQRQALRAVAAGAGLPAVRAGAARRVARAHGPGGRRARARTRSAATASRSSRSTRSRASRRGSRTRRSRAGRRRRRPGLPVPVRGVGRRAGAATAPTPRARR